MTNNNELISETASRYGLYIAWMLLHCKLWTLDFLYFVVDRSRRLKEAACGRGRELVRTQHTQPCVVGTAQM